MAFLYIAIPFTTAVHKCCCGCGLEVVTPISHDWELALNGAAVSPFALDWQLALSLPLALLDSRGPRPLGSVDVGCCYSRRSVSTTAVPRSTTTENRTRRNLTICRSAWRHPSLATLEAAACQVADWGRRERSARRALRHSPTGCGSVAQTATSRRRSISFIAWGSRPGDHGEEPLADDDAMPWVLIDQLGDSLFKRKPCARRRRHPRLPAPAGNADRSLRRVDRRLGAACRVAARYG
jgi:hypothetical protein